MTCEPAFDDPAFLSSLRAGDPAAWGRLIRRANPPMVSAATAIIGSRAQAEEVVQDSWIAAWSGIERFEGRSSLTAWLHRIVVNRARTRIVQEKRTLGLDVLGPIVPRDDISPERIVSDRQMGTCLRKSVAALPRSQRAVLVLRARDGLKTQDICRILEIGPENQRVLLHRARATIRGAMDALTGQTIAAG